MKCKCILDITKEINIIQSVHLSSYHLIVPLCHHAIKLAIKHCDIVPSSNLAIKPCIIVPSQCTKEPLFHLAIIALSHAPLPPVPSYHLAIVPSSLP